MKIQSFLFFYTGETRSVSYVARRDNRITYINMYSKGFTQFLSTQMMIVDGDDVAFNILGGAWVGFPEQYRSLFLTYAHQRTTTEYIDMMWDNMDDIHASLVLFLSFALSFSTTGLLVYFALCREECFTNSAGIQPNSNRSTMNTPMVLLGQLVYVYIMPSDASINRNIYPSIHVYIYIYICMSICIYIYIFK